MPGMFKYTFLFIFFYIISVYNAQTLSDIYRTGKVNIKTEYILKDEKQGLLSFISKVWIDEKENLCVFDRKEMSLFVLDKKKNKLEKKAGGKGSGPGELNSSREVEYNPIIGFSVFDYMRRMIVTYNKEYRFVKNVSFHAGVIHYRQLNNGNYCVMENEDLYSENEKMSVGVYIYNNEGKKIKKLYSTSYEYWQLAGKNGRYRIPYSPEVEIGLLKNGNIVVANSADFSVRIYKPDGSLFKEFTYQMERSRITRKEKKIELKWSNVGFTKRDPSTIKFPLYKPYYSHMVQDSEGNILFCQFAVPDANEQAVVVFNQNGNFIAKPVIPGIILNYSLFWKGRKVYTPFVDEKTSIPCIAVSTIL